MNEELMRVVQPPIIAEQLQAVKQEVERRTQEAITLSVSAETLQTARTLRASLNRDFQEAERRRKEIKNAVTAPYAAFEAVYRTCISDAFRQADEVLSKKIRAVEDGLKAACEQRLRAYFAELCAVRELDFLRFEQTGISIDLASARQKTPKKLMEALAEFCDRVAQDVAVIRMGEDCAEVLTEYKKTLSLRAALATVQARKDCIERERAREAQRRDAEGQAPEEATPLSAPVPQRVQKDAPERLTASFRVTDTKARLRLLRDFLNANHYDYENL